MNWTIGQYIVEFEQSGADKAEYGKNILIRLSKDLTAKLGKGFSRSNLANMRLFYRRFPTIQTVSGQLSWSHYIEIISLDDDLERQFYMIESVKNNWGIRELKRQINSGLFPRLALSKDKEGILRLAKSGQVEHIPHDIVKNSYVLEFLGLPEKERFLERDLELALTKHLEEFLLELGKGFAFIGRQVRLTIGNEDYYADLVFYHVILKRYVIIDLKVGKVKHEDIGQMNLYLGYYALDKNNEDDNPPIGIILGADKDDTMVEYATYGMDTDLFVSKYQLYLPDIEDLRELVRQELEEK
jgi:predicted nuclease of restriction endonuclease-like (RecB) superfamily